MTSSDFPQTNASAYDAAETILTNPHDGTRLAGILTLPKATPLCPAMLLIPDSGKQDRDQSMLKSTAGHRPFAVWADTLSKMGIAVLRLDDRGVGGSSGDKNQATHGQLLSDICAALDWLAKQPGIDPGRIGVLGHGEGGMLAMAAAQCPAVSLAVLLAAPGLPGESIVLSQAEAVSRANGADYATIAHERDMNHKVFALLKTDHSADVIQAQVMQTLEDALLSWPGGQFDAESANFHARAMAGIVLTPVFRSFLRCDPAKLLRRAICPVLALTGEKDIQVEPHANLAAIRTALKDAPCQQATVEMVKGVNHLLQDCKTGRMEEYETIAHAISPRVLKQVEDWVGGIWKFNAIADERPFLNEYKP